MLKKIKQYSMLLLLPVAIIRFPQHTYQISISSMATIVIIRTAD